MSKDHGRGGETRVSSIQGGQLSRSYFRKLTSESYVIKVLGRGDSLDGSSDVVLLHRVVEVSDGRVSLVVGTENLLGLVLLVGLVNRGNWKGN